MRFQGLDLNLLVVLNALLVEQNVSTAAQKLRLSQSATSAALNRLRGFFGDDILRLVSRRMVLTPLGERLVEPVRKALQEIETAITTSAIFDPEECTRRFTISSADATISAMLSQVIQKAALSAPKMSFDFLLPGDCIIDDIGPATLLDRGEIDILVTPESWSTPEHPWRFLWSDELAVIAWDCNPLASNGLTLEQYLSARHVCTQFSRLRHMPLDACLRREDLARNIDIVVPSFELALPFIIGCERLLTTPRSFAERCKSLYPVRTLSPRFPLPIFRMGLQWHSNRSSDRALQWLIHLITEGTSTPPHRAATQTRYSTSTQVYPDDNLRPLSVIRH